MPVGLRSIGLCQSSLSNFSSIWNTESPQVKSTILCTLGGYRDQQENFTSSIFTIQISQEETEDYGIDYDGPVVREDNEQIKVTESNLRLNPDNATRLQAACNPLTVKSNRYLFVRDFMSVCDYSMSS